MRLNKTNALRCGKCDYQWHLCIDYSFVPGGRGQYAEEWDSTDWPEVPRKTTRRKTKSPRAKRSATPRKSAKDTEAYATPALDPPWNSKTAAVTPPVAAEGPKLANDTLAEQKLQKLVAALEKQDTPLDPEIQQLVEEATVKPASSKTMHTAVAKLDQARKKLQAAQSARHNHQTKWTKYLEESITRWKKFAEDFAAQDKDLETKVVQAKEKLQEARTVLDNTKEQLTKQDEEFLNDPEVISDMDDDLETSDKIQNGISAVVANLEAIRVRPATEADGRDENAAKKPRLDGRDAGGQSTSPHGSKMLQPFATAGR